MSPKCSLSSFVETINWLFFPCLLFSFDYVLLWLIFLIYLSRINHSLGWLHKIYHIFQRHMNLLGWSNLLNSCSRFYLKWVKVEAEERWGPVKFLKLWNENFSVLLPCVCLRSHQNAHSYLSLTRWVSSHFLISFWLFKVLVNNYDAFWVKGTLLAMSKMNFLMISICRYCPNYFPTDITSEC